MEHGVLVAQQFGSTARAYLESVTHATGKDLEWLATEVTAQPGAAVLDLGCGAGHASFAVAPHAGAITAYDPTAEMLEIVRREAARLREHPDGAGCRRSAALSRCALRARDQPLQRPSLA